MRVEFADQCVYCRAVTAVKGVDSFGVDHYRPQKQFPLLATEYLNLFYSCNRCNALKGAFWPSVSQKKFGHFVPNPCEHVMLDHLRYRRGTVKATSLAGELTSRLLDLNDPGAIQLREAIIASLELLERELIVLQKLAADAHRKLTIARTAQERASIQGALNQAQLNVAESEAAIKTLGG